MLQNTEFCRFIKNCMNNSGLNILEKTLERVKEHKLVHKNGKSREDIV